MSNFICYCAIALVACIWYIDLLPPTLFGAPCQFSLCVFPSIYQIWCRPRRWTYFFFPASVRRQTIAHLLPGLLSESSDQCWGLQLAERDKRICPQPSTSCWFHPRPSIAELKTSAFVLLRVPLFNLWKYMLFEIGISRNWGLADMGSFQTLLNNVTLVVFN